MINKLFAISPIDGRYSKLTRDLADFFSESALIKYRIKVECYYLTYLLNFLDFSELLDTNQKDLINNLYTKLELRDFENIKQIEQITNHDIKAVEYFIKHFLSENKLSEIKELVHFGLTSEDINNIAYNLMLKDSLNEIIYPSLQNILIKLSEMVESYKKIPMLSKTHGQSATPTTLGKELAVFLNRINEQFIELKNIKLMAKLTGATGNYNALNLAYPDKNWIEFSKSFLNTLELNQNIAVTQIEPHDKFAQIFDNIVRINNILIDMNIDIWQYISLNYFKLIKKEEETGSSTMPHKVNPIDFENSEGNLGLSNSLLSFFSSKLTKSRLQRDLSDSTVLRNIGSALAYSLIAYKSCLRGLNKLSVNQYQLQKDLDDNFEVITEGIQTILRSLGINNPYEKMKEISRGNKIDKTELSNYLKSLDLSKDILNKIENLTPSNYIGLSVNICDNVLDKFTNNTL